MLALTTQLDETVEIWLPDGRKIVFTDLGHRGDKSRIGFEAPDDVMIFRKVVADKVRADIASGRRKFQTPVSLGGVPSPMG